jgi:hypothetical protein
MSTPKQDRARALDERAGIAFREAVAERDPEKRVKRWADYAVIEAQRLAAWEDVGPDPLIADVKVALDRAAARDSDPNPDDPDDEATE